MITSEARIKQWRLDPLKFVTDCFKVTPDSWQIDVLKKLGGPNNPRRRIALKACTGAGKAQPLSTLIPTNNGTVKMGDLKVGDTVLAQNGSKTHVKAIADWGLMDVYEITFSDGSKTEACGEHLWKVKHRDKSKWIVQTTKELLEKNVRLHNRRYYEIPRQGAAKFTQRSRKNRPGPLIDPYVLGLWIGDGGRNSSKITSADDEIVHQIKIRGYQVYTHKLAHNVYGLSKHLRSLGLFESYSYEKKIPEAYKFMSVARRKDLLRGLMDTDGCIDARNNHSEFSTTSKQLAEDVVWLVQSLGGVAKIKKTIKKSGYRNDKNIYIKCRDCYRISVTTSFCPFLLRRKASRWKVPQERYLKRYIDNIKLIGRKNVRCIEIAHGSHCYLTNNFIVTHNSTVLAWIGWHRLACYCEKGDHPKGAALSGEGRDNLRDNLWAELSKWQQKSDFLKAAFKWNAERIYAVEHSETWFLSARSYPKEADPEAIGRSLSGLHSKFPFILLDECGDMPISVGQKATQIFTGGVVDALIFADGNPTSINGLLYQIFGPEAELWDGTTITADPDDPKRTSRVSVEHAREMIRLYGRENPWVMATILGLFPPSGFNSLISLDEVGVAIGRHLTSDQYDTSQKRLGVDCARFGDDLTVIAPRQGLAAFKMVEMRNARSNDIAARVIVAKLKWGSEQEMVDGTGGYGSGVIDSMIQAGYSPYEVQFSGKAIDPRYANKRAEMWFEMAKWIKRGAALPNDQRLKKELIAPTYTFNNGKFLLEPKEQIKKRLGFSTDKSDALALTFALPEMPAGIPILHPSQISQGGKVLHEYDPFEFQEKK